MNKWFQLAQIFGTLAGLSLVAVGFGYTTFWNSYNIINQNIITMRSLISSNLTSNYTLDLVQYLNQTTYSWADIANETSKTNFNMLLFSGGMIFLTIAFAFIGFTEETYKEKTTRKKMIDIFIILLSMILLFLWLMFYPRP